MVLVNFENHGYFHGVVSPNGEVAYRLGRKKTCSQNLWELGDISFNKYDVRIRLQQSIELADYLPQQRESLQAVNNLNQLGAINFWMNSPYNNEMLKEISPNIITNRSTLKLLCSRDYFRDTEKSFLARQDEHGRLVFHREPLAGLDDNLSGIAFEKFITGRNDPMYDYREKMYTVQSLKIGNHNILYNAEFVGFMNIPRSFELDSQGFQFGRALPCELKLWSGVGYQNRMPEHWRIKSWFLQCILAGIDDIIIGVNPQRYPDPAMLTGVRVYKTADLPYLCNADLSAIMWRNLQDVLDYIDAQITFNADIFKITIPANGLICHALWQDEAAGP